MDKKGKVLQFPNQQPFYDFMEDMKMLYEQNRLSEFICIYQFEYNDEQKKENIGSTKGINHYWFGKNSSVYLLGLIQIMKEEILDWIRKRNSDRDYYYEED